jgi:ankyrin repeat protein
VEKMKINRHGLKRREVMKKYMVIFSVLVGAMQLHAAMPRYTPQQRRVPEEFITVASRNNVSAMERLLQDSPDLDINYVGRLGRTPLGAAAYYGNLKAVNFLLENEEVDVNKKNMGGGTPLILAVRENKKDVVERLLEDPRVDLALTNDEGKTALDIAEEKGYTEILDLILGKISMVKSAGKR